MVVGVMGTALISPLYALYKDVWQLQTSDVSAIYVIYMSGALCSLLFLGRLSDRIGFRRVMLAALVLAMLGTFISMVAWNMASLTVGRFIVGVASSMVTTSANIGLSALSSSGSAQRTAMMTGFLIAFGFGLGPLVGGIMGQWMPYPLVTTYVPTLVLGLLGIHALRTVQMPARARQAAEGSASALHWRDCLPRLTWPPEEDSTAFVLTCGFPFLAFGVFGLYASMAPLFLSKMVSWHGPFMSGAAIAVILLASAGVQVASGSLRTHRCGRGGMLALVLSNALLVANLWAGSAILFALGVALTAIGHGMSMLAGMSMVNRIAKPHNRAGLLSTYLVIGYIGSMVPMMGIGWIADHWGLNAAVSIFCFMVMVLGTGLGLAFARHPRMRAAAQEA